MINVLERLKLEAALATMPVHKKAASSPRSMIQVYNWINRNTTISPRSIVEIGANYSQDAYALAKLWKVKDNLVWAIEAHPDICHEARKLYPNISVINEAVYDVENEITINLVRSDFENSGVSSLLYNPNYNTGTETFKIKTKRMSNIISDYEIECLDFVKVDVEGATHEVLESFDDHINDIKILHLELEHKEIWIGQKTFSDTEKFLRDNGFICGWMDRHGWQSDSIWLKEQHYN